MDSPLRYCHAFCSSFALVTITLCHMSFYHCFRWPSNAMWGDLGKPTHTLVPCWMLKPLPSRNQCTVCFAPALNPCLQGTSVWVGSPQPMQGKPRKILGSSTLPEYTRSCHNYYTLRTVQSFDPLQARGLVYNISYVANFCNIKLKTIPTGKQGSW